MCELIPTRHTRAMRSKFARHRGNKSYILVADWANFWKENWGFERGNPRNELDTIKGGEDRKLYAGIYPENSVGEWQAEKNLIRLLATGGSSSKSAIYTELQFDVICQQLARTPYFHMGNKLTIHSETGEKCHFPWQLNSFWFTKANNFVQSGSATLEMSFIPVSTELANPEFVFGWVFLFSRFFVLPCRVPN